MQIIEKTLDPLIFPIIMDKAMLHKKEGYNLEVSVTNGLYQRMIGQSEYLGFDVKTIIENETLSLSLNMEWLIDFELPEDTFCVYLNPGHPIDITTETKGSDIMDRLRECGPNYYRVNFPGKSLETEGEL